MLLEEWWLSAFMFRTASGQALLPDGRPRAPQSAAGGLSTHGATTAAHSEANGGADPPGAAPPEGGNGVKPLAAGLSQSAGAGELIPALRRAAHSVTGVRFNGGPSSVPPALSKLATRIAPGDGAARAFSVSGFAGLNAHGSAQPAGGGGGIAPQRSVGRAPSRAASITQALALPGAGAADGDGLPAPFDLQHADGRGAPGCLGWLGLRGRGPFAAWGGRRGDGTQGCLVRNGHVLVYRGLRVRMGVHSGLKDALHVHMSSSTGRCASVAFSGHVR